MDINEIMEIADKAYDQDGILLCQWDSAKRYPRKTPLLGMNDTLAKFIVVEIFETYDPKANYEQQLMEANRVIQRAAGQLRAVASKLTDVLHNKKMDALCDRIRGGGK